MTPWNAAGQPRSSFARPASPDDEELVAELAELRRITAELDEALRDGRPDATLTRRQATLERSVRRRALRARGSKAIINGARPSLETLGDRTLVEFFALEGRLHAITVRAGKAALHPLGAENDVGKEVASLRFSLRSLATARPGSRAGDAMAGVCATVAARLDQLLIAPLRLNEREPLVLVPTGELHALPWSMLPSLAHRPLSVAPSLRLWQRANAATRTDGRAVLVAGPRLPAATEEIRTLGERHPQAVTLTGDEATVAGVAHALDGADSAHLAAHGHFRDDNPSFCSLELADGALTVYDLERLTQTPRRLVLSSCESGLSTVHAGDELMGFTAAMFALGTATVIAAVVPVPDEATKGLMLALDEELHRGTHPAQALVTARDAIGGDESRRTVARAAFVCFGAG